MSVDRIFLILFPGERVLENELMNTSQFYNSRLKQKKCVHFHFTLISSLIS